MLKKITLILFLSSSFFGVSQDFSSLWKGHFSYFDIKDVTQSDTNLYAASENAIFSYDFATNEINTITTIEGLSGETITTIHYSFEYQVLVIGYQNGLVELYFETDGSILSVVDILDKETVPPNKKTINHFYELNGLVYISTGYGISVYDLQRLEFGDTFFIGNGGSQINIEQTAVLGDVLYAACGDNGAIKTIAIDNPNIIDYAQWQTLNNGNFLAIESVDDRLYAIKSNNVIYEIVNNNFNALFTYAETPLDLRAVNGDLLVTTQTKVFVYSSGFSPIGTASTTAEFTTQFRSTILHNDNLYIATSSFGVLTSQLSLASEFTVIRPNGPLRNDMFKINASYSEVWATYGDYSNSYNAYPIQSYGISHLIDEQWVNIPYDSVLNAKNLVNISINPFNPQQVFVSSYFSGLLEFNNGAPTILYNQTNSGLESLVDGSPDNIDIRVSGSLFDRTGLLWTITSKIGKPLKSYDPSSQQWQSYSFLDLIADPIRDEGGFGDLVIDNNGTKWTASLKNGVIAYNENAGENKIGRLYTQEQNMPTTNIKSLAIDNRNQLWIGTFRGLRVLYNTSNFLTDPNPRASEIVIVEEGVPKELLSLQFISDIKVDGSNNKWIGTDNSGVFYLSPDGQQTIYHFTTDNSPLPSNDIRDISIDAQSGTVYFATGKGLVSFSAGGTSPEIELADAFVYPNPVRPEYNILGGSNLNDINSGVKIKGLTENVNVKITDIEGNLVAEAQSRINLRTSRTGYNFAIDGGTAIWNGKNMGNNVVASGVYLILINDLDSFETKVLKLLIIR